MSTSNATKTGERLFKRALEALSTEQQGIIQRHVASKANDIREAVDNAYEAAKQKKQLCEQKRWTCRINQRDVVLADVADKVLDSLDKLKDVGDFAAAVAPIHFGLPWAAFSLLLQTALHGRDQAAALLTGMDLTLSSADQLKEHIEFLDRLPERLATRSFESALVKMYTRMLQFLADAIKIYQKNPIARAFAFWGDSDLDGFRNDIHQLSAEINIIGNQSDRVLSNLRWDAQTQWQANLEAPIAELNRNAVRSNLSKLSTAKGAIHSSYDNDTAAKCLDGTRIDLLRSVKMWFDGANSKCIFWLHGMAGTGKSTISRTVAADYQKGGKLGASFFFKRGESDRGHARRLFPTLAIQLADRFPALVPSIDKALQADSSLDDSNLHEQFEKLISEPLKALDFKQHVRSNILIVLDALDECEPTTDIRIVLGLLGQLNGEVRRRLRIFITSRPEVPIQMGFRRLLGSLHDEVVLEDVQATSIESDIRAYFVKEFKDIQEEDEEAYSYEPLPKTWPGDDVIETLVTAAVPLFIFAATLCRFISEFDPQERLAIILKQQHSPTLGLGQVYRAILDQMMSYQQHQNVQDVIAKFQEVVGCIVLLADPLSASSLSRLLDMSMRDIQGTLKHLHSVLNVPPKADQPIKTLHLSFREFLVESDSKIAGDFAVDRDKKHLILKDRCLRLLSDVLRNDMLNLGRPGVRRSDIQGDQISENIPEAVAYACSNWIWHLLGSNETKNALYDWDDIDNFLRQHFLHWLEAMSWLGRLRQALAQINHLRDRVDFINSGGHRRREHLFSFVNDARRFLMRHSRVIELAPLQLYSSALTFSPLFSVVRTQFESRNPQTITMVSKAPGTWSSELLQLESGGQGSKIINFSSDGHVISSAAPDSLKLWDPDTGEELFAFLPENNDIEFMVFSSELEVIALASSNEIKVYNAVNGQLSYEISGLPDPVSRLAFSPGTSPLLLSASDDGTMILWNAATGNETQRLSGHDGEVFTISFATDGEHIVTSSYDRTIRLWSVADGRELRKLTSGISDIEIIIAAAFCPLQQQNCFLGCRGSGAVYLWDTTTGTSAEKLLQFDACDVDGLAVSQDGQMLAIGLSDQTVRVWDIRGGQELQRYVGHLDSIDAVCFSPDGNMVASGSRDGTVRLWGIHSSNLPIQPLKQTQKSTSSVCLSHCEVAISRLAGPGCTMSVWNAESGAQVQEIISPLAHKSTAEEDIAVHCTALSADGRILALALSDGAVRLFDLARTLELQKLVGCSNFEINFNRSADGELVLSTVQGEQARRMDLLKRKQPRLERFHNFSAISFSHDGHLIAAASNETELKFGYWTVDKMARKDVDALFDAHATFADGQRVTAVPLRQVVWLWDVRTGDLMRSFEHENRLFAIALSSDGQTLASVSRNVLSRSLDATVHLWDTSTGAMLSSFQIAQPVKTLHFVEQDNLLETDKGWIDLSAQNLSLNKPGPVCHPILDVQDDWIRLNHEDTLWLPSEYRASCHCSQAGRLAIGHETGTVTFFTTT